MTQRENLEYFRDKGLLPFQARIALNFLRSDKPYWEVIAPTGTGKTRLGVALIAYEMEDRRKKRILVLAPSLALLANWRSELLSFGMPFTDPTYGPFLIDRKTYLELESSVPVGQSPWPLPAVVLMTIDLAKRDDMITSLTSATWDLAIFDEAHVLVGKRKKVFDRLIEAGAIRRALLLTQIETRLPSDLVTKVKIGHKDIVDWSKRPLFASFEKKLTPVYYVRSEEEQIFLSELQTFAEQLSSELAYGKRLKKIILRVASSSIYATDRMLRRLSDSWRILRNKISHGMPLADEDVERINRQMSMFTDELWVSDDLSDSLAIRPREFLALYEKLEYLLRQIDMIETDPKLNALISYVRERYKLKDKSRLCILSSFADTIEYLRSGFQDLGIHAYSLTSALELTARMKKMETFLEYGGILLLTDAASEGLGLESIDECLNYDLPADPRMFEQRWARFIRFGREAEFKMVVFIDTSKVLPWEEEQFKTLKDVRGIK